jgi:hypothetical protein
VIGDGILSFEFVGPRSGRPSPNILWSAPESFGSGVRGSAVADGARVGAQQVYEVRPSFRTTVHVPSTEFPQHFEEGFGFRFSVLGLGSVDASESFPYRRPAVLDAEIDPLGVTAFGRRESRHREPVGRGATASGRVV